MGQAKQRRDEVGGATGVPVKLTRLSQPSAENSPLLRTAGAEQIAQAKALVLNAFRAEVGARSFCVGFTLGTGDKFTSIGVAVVDRIVNEAPGQVIGMAPVTSKVSAYAGMMRRLRSFEGKALIFCFADWATFNIGMADLFHSDEVSVFDEKGSALKRLTSTERNRMKNSVPAGNRAARQEIFAVSGLKTEVVE